MIPLIIHQLTQLGGPASVGFHAGYSVLGGSFEYLQQVTAGEFVWSGGEEKPILYFNGIGVLAEFTEIQGQLICLRIIPPNSLFWSESSFLMWEKTDTYLRCKIDTHVYGVSGQKIREITAQYGMGFTLANALTKLDLIKYRNRCKDLNLLQPVDRLRKTLEANPHILSYTSREELAGYLGLSRSSLFRAIHALHDGG